MEICHVSLATFFLSYFISVFFLLFLHKYCGRIVQLLWLSHVCFRRLLSCYVFLYQIVFSSSYMRFFFLFPFLFCFFFLSTVPFLCTSLLTIIIRLYSKITYRFVIFSFDFLSSFFIFCHYLFVCYFHSLSFRRFSSFVYRSRTTFLRMISFYLENQQYSFTSVYIQ